MQQVVDNLLISKVELRSEDSADVRRYAQDRCVEQIKITLTDDIEELKAMYTKVRVVSVDSLLAVTEYISYVCWLCLLEIAVACCVGDLMAFLPISIFGLCIFLFPVTHTDCSTSADRWQSVDLQHREAEQFTQHPDSS